MSKSEGNYQIKKGTKTFILMGFFYLTCYEQDNNKEGKDYIGHKLGWT